MESVGSSLKEKIADGSLQKELEEKNKKEEAKRKKTLKKKKE